MTIADQKSSSDGKVWGFFKRPFRPSGNTTVTTSSTSSSHNAPQHGNGPQGDGSNPSATNSVSSVARSLLPTRRRLKLDPHNKLYFPLFKFVEVPENNEKLVDQKSRVKFKIMSLKVKGAMDYVPELFDELKDQVAIEQILRVVFLDPERSTPAMEKLKRQLADADAALEERKKPPEDAGPKIIGEGLVIDEWKERRERYLARQQVEGVDSA
ncbi:vesicle-associated protein 4-2 isoform X2 [Prunus dulcis]|uniref:vesicle-associated protein 4-2 isoform X2 n=1 Tax=Prunus dulcis TaxID=3755 RepID=UPI001482BF79|nr:vesicle-associated protein 4-2 isoform X2 [Prunus dulcis]